MMTRKTLDPVIECAKLRDSLDHLDEKLTEEFREAASRILRAIREGLARIENVDCQQIIADYLERLAARASPSSSSR